MSCESDESDAGESVGAPDVARPRRAGAGCGCRARRGQDGGVKVAARSQVPPFAVMEVIAAANARRAAGADVLNLCAGEPAGGAPAAVREAAAAALTGGSLGYTEALGMPALRAEIAAHYRALVRRRGGPRLRRRDDGGVRRVRAGVPRRVRGGGPGGGGAPRVPRVPEPHHRAGLRGGRRAVRPRGPVPADGRAARRARRRRRADRRAGARRARRTRPGRSSSPRRWTRSPHGARRTACGWSPTRSTTGSPTGGRAATAPGRRLRRPVWPTVPWWSARSPSTGR